MDLWCDPENFSLWVRDEKDKLVHLQHYDSLCLAEQAMHDWNSYAGGDGRQFKLYHKPKGEYRYKLFRLVDTRSTPPTS